MEKASQELLKNDEVFYESKCLKIDENDIRKIIAECLRRIKA